MQYNIPKLSIDILSNIVCDAVDLCPSITAVGLVGSLARGKERHNSDVDIIVKHDNKINFNSVLESFGMHVKHILDYQFNKRLDIIRYDYAVTCASRTPNDNEPWFCQKSFLQMLEEVKWLYER